MCIHCFLLICYSPPSAKFKQALSHFCLCESVKSTVSPFIKIVEHFSSILSGAPLITNKQPPDCKPCTLTYVSIKKKNRVFYQKILVLILSCYFNMKLYQIQINLGCKFDIFAKLILRTNFSFVGVKMTYKHLLQF